VPLPLNERVIFVVGKGGVGKTTAACAMALASADRGEPTHLISTDPAHSIADVLGDTADLHRPTASTCSPQLTAEAFDARSYAQSLFTAARPALAMLVEQGTWLDAEDAQRFLDLSLPGVDEIMAALRIAELFDKNAGRIVVDTAPTGHTLRLLGAADTFDGWIAALHAMADKAGAVASAFAGRSISLPAEILIDEWSIRMQTFRRVLPAAGFVVVSREGSVVEAETVRLTRELRQRGLRLVATVVTAPSRLPVATGAAPPIAAVPWLTDATGCDGLRGWWSAVGTPVASPPANTLVSPAIRRGSNAVQKWLQTEAPELLLFAGKGGVGKTTCAAAVALLSAQFTPTRLFSTDPAGSLGEVLDTPVTTAPTDVHGSTAVQIDAATDFARLRRDYGAAVEQVFAQLGIGGGAMLDRRVMASLWDMAPPGLDEIMAVVRLMEEIEPDRRIVVDTAPTGHFLNLLAIPGAGVEWTHALLRVLLKYRAAAVLEEATRDVLAIARQLRAFRDRLRDPARTGVVIVTLDEPVVWNETRRLHESLILANIPVAALILNRADAGPARGLPPLNPMPRIIRAPIHATPAGRDRLLDFVTGWEFLEQ